MKYLLSALIIVVLFTTCKLTIRAEELEVPLSDSLSSEILRNHKFLEANHLSIRQYGLQAAIEMQRNRILQEAVNKGIPIIIEK